MPLRALVLAAGRGERLRPLTDLVPKPLLPVLGRPILEHTLERLAAAGVESTAINLHHLGDQIPAWLGDEAEGMQLVYSPEEELLGTLGPLARLAGFLGASDPFLLVNGDSLCAWPLGTLLERQRSGAAAATLLLSSRADPDAFGGGVVVDESDHILSFDGTGSAAGARRGVFAGLHVITGDLLLGLEERPSDIVRDLYEPLLEDGRALQAVFTDLPWHDLGTPSRYLRGVLDTAAGGGGWRAEGAEVDGGAVVETSVLESGSVVESRARVQGSLLMEGAVVASGSLVRDSILGPGVTLGPRAGVEASLVTRAPAGCDPISSPI